MQCRRSLLVSLVILFWMMVLPLSAQQKGRPVLGGDASDPFASLKPVDSGPGVLICAPTGALADFGAGCSRWLQFHLANCGELGKMPAPSQVYACQEARHRTDMRLTLAEALSLAKPLGVTHVATATLTGSSSQASLSYQLVDVASGKSVGAPCTAFGSDAKITAELPRLAQDIVKTLGVKTQQPLKVIHLTAADVETIGRFAWVSLPNLTADESRTIAGLMEKDPLGALLAARSINFLETRAADNLLNRVLPAGGDNLALLAEMAVTQPGVLQNAGKAAQAKASAFPNNYLAQIAYAHEQRLAGDRAKEKAAVERAVRCSPGNAQPWLSLAKYYSDSAESGRRGRVGADLTKEEWDLLADEYLRETLAIARSVEIDDRSAHAWSRLATAATFSGVHDLAVKAYEQAISLDPNSYEALLWGTEMFQPKWLDDEMRLKAVFAQVQKATFPVAEQAIGMSLVLENFNLDGTALKSRFEEQQKAQIAQNPKKLLPYINLAHLYERQVRYAHAAAMYQKIGEQGLESANYATLSANQYRVAGMNEQAQQMAPKAKTIQSQTGRAADGGRAQPAPVAPAETNAQKADKPRASAKHDQPTSNAALPPVPEPKTAAEFAARARSLQINEFKDQIEKDYRAAIRLDPKNGSYHFGLANMLLNTGRSADAVEEYRAAIKFDGTDVYFEYLASAYLNQNKKDEAIAALKEGANQKTPTNASLYNRLAEHYLSVGDYEAAKKTAERGLQTFANTKYPMRNYTPALNFQIGEALFKQGKVKEARAYWQKAADYESPTPLVGIEEAKKRLQENP